uniref:Zinc transporter ZIP1 n=1 Tax=Caenorhabditis japonica TaxID=281687 RepID=A0A8R1I2W9_CAEJA
MKLNNITSWHLIGRILETNYERSEPRDSLRAVLLFLLFLLTFASGMIATLLKGQWARSYILSFVACIGGGVFLGACLLDLLPDCIESFENVKLSTKFPVPLAFVALGFLIVLTIDQLMKTAKDRNIFGRVGNYLHIHEHEEQRESQGESIHQSGISVSLLVCALSVHALFEGISLAVVPEATQILQVCFKVL